MRDATKKDRSSKLDYHPDLVALKESNDLLRQKVDELAEKLHKARTENAEQRLELARMQRTVSESKKLKEDVAAKQAKFHSKQEKDMMASEILIKELKQLKLENKKLRKLNKESFKKAKNASTLFKETLKVKLQYEKLIISLNERPKISDEIQTIIKQQPSMSNQIRQPSDKFAI